MTHHSTQQWGGNSDAGRKALVRSEKKSWSENLRWDECAGKAIIDVSNAGNCGKESLWNCCTPLGLVSTYLGGCEKHLWMRLAVRTNRWQHRRWWMESAEKRRARERRQSIFSSASLVSVNSDHFRVDSCPSCDSIVFVRWTSLFFRDFTLSGHGLSNQRSQYSLTGFFRFS